MLCHHIRLRYVRRKSTPSRLSITSMVVQLELLDIRQRTLCAMCIVGCNSFRISLEWSRLVPQKGVVDKAAVQRYHDIFDCVERYVAAVHILPGGCLLGSL